MCVFDHPVRDAGLGCVETPPQLLREGAPPIQITLFLASSAPLWGDLFLDIVTALRGSRRTPCSHCPIARPPRSPGLCGVPAPTCREGGCPCVLHPGCLVRGPVCAPTAPFRTREPKTARKGSPRRRCSSWHWGSGAGTGELAGECAHRTRTLQTSASHAAERLALGPARPWRGLRLRPHTRFAPTRLRLAASLPVPQHPSSDTFQRPFPNRLSKKCRHPQTTVSPCVHGLSTRSLALKQPRRCHHSPPPHGGRPSAPGVDVSRLGRTWP